MLFSLQRRTRRRKLKGNRWSKGLFFAFLLFFSLAVAQAFAYHNRAEELKKELKKKPKTIEKTKTEKEIKIKWKTKYINKKGQDVTEIVEYTRKKFGRNGKVALAVFNAESGLDSGAINSSNSNGSIDRGIAQINSCHCGWVDCSRLKDWKYNIDIAYKLSKGGTNWSPWVAYKNGNYSRYLNSF